VPDVNDHTASRTDDGLRLHSVINQLSVIIGFCELLLAEIPADDRKHADVLEMRKAAEAAMSLLDPPREAP
jgi:hypothetical protein